LDRGPAPRFLYDGTIGSLCDCFERHPESPISDVQRSTAESYADSLKVIRATVANRAVRALTPIDVKAWYREWRAPGHEGGPERVKRAHDAVATFRMIINFGIALGHAECGSLSEGLSKMRFERSSPRESQMTLAHAPSSPRRSNSVWARRSASRWRSVSRRSSKRCCGRRT
jgi:hypothetical protein